MDIINRRRSVRQFSEKEVPVELVTSLLKAAMQAPSAHNEQPWRFIVITKKGTLETMSQLSSSSKLLKEAPMAILLITDLNLLKSPTMYAQDMSAATQNILLEATSLGLGSCWIGVYGRPDRMKGIHDFFQLKDHEEPFSLIALGYPLQDAALSHVDRYQADRVKWE